MRSITFSLALALRATSAYAWPTQSFKTATFNPPVFQVQSSGGHLAPGLILLTPTDPSDSAAIIVDNNGGLVWNGDKGFFANANVQTLNGQNVLTFWNGSGNTDPSLRGHGYGQVHILDSTYTPIHRVCPDIHITTPGNIHYDCTVDAHEAYITPKGSILVTAYNVTTADLTSIGGSKDGYVYDCLIFEIDIQTQDILFQWSALHDGFKVSDTFATLGTSGTRANPFDFFHINSIQSVDGGYLASSRHTWTTFKVNTQGDVEWKFQGSTGGDFKLDPGANFQWQHHPRVIQSTPSTFTFSMFDNGNAADQGSHGTNQTKGRVFALDLAQKSSKLLNDYFDGQHPLYADSQGSFETLPNGNVFLGYGAIPMLREFGPNGDVRLQMQFGDLEGQQSSYRAFRLQWNASPAAPPAIYATRGKSYNSVYVSWNGATDVTSYDVYEGMDSKNLRLTQNVLKSGFETQARLSTQSKFVRAVPRTAKGPQQSSPVVAVQ